MHGFSDVKITWRGDEYTIPANQVMRVIMGVEDAIMRDGSKQALVMLLERGVPMSRLSSAYAIALRCAGCSVTDEEVYLSLQAALAGAEGGVGLDHITAWNLSLVHLISPPMHEALTGGEDKPGKAEAAA